MCSVLIVIYKIGDEDDFEYGTLEQYKEEHDFESYLVRMDQFFLVNNIVAAKRNALFITLVGPDAYATLKDLWAPINPSTVSFEKNVGKLKNHFKHFINYNIKTMV